MEGWHGWDAYARFYDWENRRTLGRRDVRFWQRLAGRSRRGVLELGCGTGRVTLPVGRTGAAVTGVDRSGEMLAVARRRARRLRTARVRLVRADIRQLPFRARAFDLVMAPYGILQSLVRDADVRATLAAVHRVLARGAWFGIDLVPDVPRWSEYRNRVSLRGRSSGGSHLTLIESVRHERDRRLTIFDQEYVETMRDGEVRSHRFSLTFRTLSIAQITRRLENAGFGVEAVLGDYEGRPWDERADVWVIMARKR